MAASTAAPFVLRSFSASCSLSWVSLARCAFSELLRALWAASRSHLTWTPSAPRFAPLRSPAAYALPTATTAANISHGLGSPITAAPSRRPP